MMKTMIGKYSVFKGGCVFLFCIVLMAGTAYSVGASDETPYNSPIPPGAVQPFNALNKGAPQKPAGRPNRPVTPPHTNGRSTTKPPAKPAAPKPKPPVVVAPSPQVVTGSGRNFGYITLRVDPLMLRVKEGEIVKQNIVLDNPRGTSVDEVEVVLKYSPSYLKVIDSETSISGINIQSLVTPQKNPGLQVVLNQVDTTKSLIYFMIKALSSNTYLNGSIASITWLAKKPTFYSPITFMFPSDVKSPGTKVRRQGKDLLGWDFDPTDGVITGGIAISQAPVAKKE